MQGALHIIKDALPLELIAEVKSYADTQQYFRSNHTSWHESVVGLSGPIYTVDIPENMQQKILLALSSKFPDFDLMNFAVQMYVSMGGRYCYIPWHNDIPNVYAATIYINEKWEKDWAGYFVYETESGKLEAVIPEFNKAIVLKTPVEHTVIMPNINAPLRYTIQVFFKKKQEEVN